MIFNQTLIDLLDKANSTQMQELELLKDIQSPNAIQLEIVNKIRLAQSQEIKHQELVKYSTEKIQKALEKITHKIGEYPENRLQTLNQIISSQEFSENKDSILQIIEILFPEHKDSIINLFENLQEVQNIDPSQIQIADFNALSIEDFQTPIPIPAPTPAPVPKPKVKTKTKVKKKAKVTQTHKAKTQSLDLESKTILEKAKSLSNQDKWFYFILSALIIFEIFSNNPEECINTNVGKLNQSSRRNLFVNHRVTLKDYIDSFQGDKDHLENHLQIGYIHKTIKDNLHRMNNISNYSIEIKYNFIDQTTQELVYTSQPRYLNPSEKQMINYESSQNIYLYRLEVNAIGFSFRKSGVNAFIPTNISIVNPITQDNFQEQYLVNYTEAIRNDSPEFVTECAH